jgi:hypothetical protein
MTASNAGDPAMDPGDAGIRSSQVISSRTRRGPPACGTGAGSSQWAPKPASRPAAPCALTVPTVTLILLPGRYGLGHYRFTGGTVYVVARVVLRIGRLDTIGPANPDRQVVPGQHSPARG